MFGEWCWEVRGIGSTRDKSDDPSFRQAQGELGSETEVKYKIIERFNREVKPFFVL